MMLAHGGIEYDDEAIWGVEFQRRKVSGEFPWDRLPMTVRVKNKARRDELNNSTFLVVPLLLIIVALLSVLLPLVPSANASYTLEHKRTLVTGASGGIGAGIAKTLAQKGARVLVHYNTRRDGAEATAHETLLVREAAAAAVVHAAVVCCRRSRSTHTRSISEY